MNNFTKKFIAAAVFVFAFAFAFTASAAWDFGPSLIKQGSQGPAAALVQTALNECSAANLVVDGKIGPISVSAIKAFQASANLTADGIVGSMTKAALNNCGGQALTPGTPGSSAEVLCPNNMTLASNCTMPPSSAPSEVLCPNNMTLASNCTMAPGATPVQPGLSGTEGTLVDFNQVSQYVDQEVLEGEKDVIVYGVEMEAQNADQVINRVRFSLENTGGDRQPERYMSNVSVWGKVGSQGAVKLGSASAISGSRVGTSREYVYTIAGLANFVIPMGQTGQILIAVDANNVIDSANLGDVVGGSVWEVYNVDIRALSPNGFSDTYPVAETSNFEFHSLTSLGDVKAAFTVGTNNPTAQIVEVSATGSSTSAIELLKFQYKAEGSNQTIYGLPITVTTGAADVQDVVTSLSLYRNGNLVQTRNVSTSDTPDEDSTVFTFTNSFEMNENQTSTLSVVANVRSVAAGGYAEGETVKADFTAANRNAANIEDAEGNELTNARKTGTAVGDNMSLYSQGLKLSAGTPIATSVVTDQAGAVVSATYKLRINIEAFGGTFYIGSGAERAAAITGTQGVAWRFLNSGGTAIAAGVIADDSFISSNLPEPTAGVYRIDEGQTGRYIDLEATVEDAGTAVSGSYRVQAHELKVWTNDALNAGGLVINLAPSTEYRTNLTHLNF